MGIVVRARVGRPRRVAMISMHTSPLDQPGSGDAGGMNVYVVEAARQLAANGTEVDIFTRATHRDLPGVVPLSPGVLVRNLSAGPLQGLGKEDLPSQLCAFSAGVLRTEASREPGFYDLVHSHYWLSGQVGWLAAERWGVPHVHTAHTWAKVKNAALAEGDAGEPRSRVIGEEQVVAAADRLLVSTHAEQRQLVGLYGADPGRIDVVAPGVDLDVFRPARHGAARARLGLPRDALVVLFAGRIQPLKAPDILIRAAAELVGRDPALRDRLVVAIVGGQSGRGSAYFPALLSLADSCGVAELVRFIPPVTRATLVDWYRAATAVVVPSHNESFGLVALEAQACGTPVVAAGVGGLTTAVRDGVSGVLVAGHDPDDYADALQPLLSSAAARRRLSAGARRHAAGFSWAATAAGTLSVYRAAMDDRAALPLVVGR